MKSATYAIKKKEKIACAGKEIRKTFSYFSKPSVHSS